MRTDRRWIAAIALFAVCLIKLAIGTTLGAHPLLASSSSALASNPAALDDAYYRHFAERVNAGDVWLSSPDSFFGRPPAPFFISPLYIYVLALFLKVGGSIEGARVAQLLLGTVAAWLVALTARRWYGARAGWIAGALAAGCGLFTFYESLILQAALDPFLTALDLYLLTRALQSDTRASWLAAGAALGLHALNRPNMLVVVLGLAIAIALRQTRNARVAGWRLQVAGLAPAALFVAGACVAVLPATLRNYAVTGEPILISSHGGLNLLIGNGPDADGTFTRAMGVPPTVGGQWLDAPRIASEAAGRSLSVAETSAFYRQRALSWVVSHPAGEARLLAKKTWYALSSVFLTLNHSFPFYARDADTGLRYLPIGPAAIFALGIVGLILARSDRPGYVVWAMFVPLSLLSVVLFFVAARYRLPFQLALVTAAGGGMSWMLDRLRARAWPSLGAAVLVLVAATTVSAWPTGLDDGRAEEQVRMGILELDRGRVAEGEAWIARAVGAAHHPFPGVVHLRVGQVHEEHGRYENALSHYQQAARIDPDEPAIRLAAARVLNQSGRPDEAVAELDRIAAGVAGDAAAREYERAGTAFVLTRQYDAILKGLDALAKAEARQPASASIRLNRAVALAMVGRTNEARAEAESALTIDPTYARARDFLKQIK